MRRTYAETRELVEARVQDFINGDSTEDVLRADLKCLYIDADEINLEVWRAKVAKEKARTHGVRRET